MLSHTLASEPVLHKGLDERRQLCDLRFILLYLRIRIKEEMLLKKKESFITIKFSMVPFTRKMYPPTGAHFTLIFVLLLRQSSNVLADLYILMGKECTNLWVSPRLKSCRQRNVHCISLLLPSWAHRLESHASLLG